jgi:hypothetical protein
MLSKSTTHQKLTSKSLCHVQNHAFGLVSTDRYFHDFHTSDFCSKISKSPYLLGFSHTYFSTLDINTTVSTWLELLDLMSLADFLNLTFTGTCQWVFLLFFIKYPFVETYRNATGVSEDRNHLVKK